MNEDGSECQFEEESWTSFMNFNLKYMNLMYKQPKAVLIVNDPKSGFRSFNESNPGIADYLSTTISMNDAGPAIMPNMVSVFFVHSDVIDKLLEGSGKNLKDIQSEIDRTLKPNSFEIKGKTLEMKMLTIKEEKQIANVAAYIEGSDPDLKNELIVFCAHSDHLGENSNGEIFYGADDNASGCAALAELAEAYSQLETPPRRSILFLWVTAEEVGLYGSKYYSDNPLFPLENTIANINIDMLGRTVSPEDDESMVSGDDEVFLLGGLQSAELLDIAKSIASENSIELDLSANIPDHPENLFQRSDHFNFVTKDIPVLFYSTGLHADYHTSEDITEKLDFRKMEKLCRMIFDVGYELANMDERPAIDKPYSTW
jgi:hypothetical protein